MTKNQPSETSRLYLGTEYISATEYLNRLYPLSVVVAPELGDEKTTILRLGQMTASHARGLNVEPLDKKLYHPDYPNGVNGWPAWVWAEGWHRFTNRYHLEWHSRPTAPALRPKMDPEPVPDEDYFTDRDPSFGAVHIVIRGRKRARCGTENLIGISNVIGARVCLRCVEDSLEEQLRQVRRMIAKGEL